MFGSFIGSVNYAGIAQIEKGFLGFRCKPLSGKEKNEKKKYNCIFSKPSLKSNDLIIV